MSADVHPTAATYRMKMLAELASNAAMAASIGMVAGHAHQASIRHGGFKPDPAPKHPATKRAKVKAARKQRNRKDG